MPWQISAKLPVMKERRTGVAFELPSARGNKGIPPPPERSLQRVKIHTHRLPEVGLIRRNRIRPFHL